MKRIIIVFLALVLVLPLFSQEGSEMIKENSNSINGVFDRGYKCTIEIGYRYGFIDPEHYPVYNHLNLTKLHIINSYQINPYFSLGFGTGFQYEPLYYFHRLLYPIVPVFADCRVSFKHSRIAPYISTGIGYCFKRTSSYTDYWYKYGFYLNPNVGVVFKITDNLALNLGVGYELQRMDYYLGYGSVYVTDSNHAINFDVGISF